MATAGSKILVSDYNSIQSTIASVMGVPATGSTYGYNQTVTSAPLTTGTKINASDWVELYNDISNAYAHITGAVPSAATLPAIASGGKIKASDIALYASAATYCSNNRLTVANANVSIVAPTAGTTVTRSAAWGGSGGATIGAQIRLTWSSEAAAAAFFNTGGYITLNLAHPSTATTQDSAWNSFLSSFGNFNLGGWGSSKTAGSGSVTSIPYSSYTAGLQTMANLSMSTANYTSNTMTISVGKYANGLTVVVYLNDNHTNAFYDAVAAGTKLSVGWIKPVDTNFLSTPIAAPTFGIITNF